MSTNLEVNTTNAPGEKNHTLGATGTLLFVLVSSSIVAAPLQSALAQSVIFGPPKQIPGTPVEDAERPQIVSAGKNAYIIWHEFPTEDDDQPDVFLSRSTNNGATFSARMNISNSPGVFSGEEFVTASGKNVFVVWTEMGTQNEIWLRKSTNSGVSFESPKKISDTGNPTFPRVSSFDKNVVVAWQADGLGGPSDIFVAQSSDTGSNFSATQNISNNDEVSEFFIDGLRQMVVSEKKVIVTWRDGSIPGAGFEIFFAQGK